MSILGYPCGLRTTLLALFSLLAACGAQAAKADSGFMWEADAAPMPVEGMCPGTVINAGDGCDCGCRVVDQDCGAGCDQDYCPPEHPAGEPSTACTWPTDQLFLRATFSEPGHSLRVTTRGHADCAEDLTDLAVTTRMIGDVEVQSVRLATLDDLVTLGFDDFAVYVENRGATTFWVALEISPSQGGLVWGATDALEPGHRYLLGSFASHVGGNAIVGDSALGGHGAPLALCP